MKIKVNYEIINPKAHLCKSNTVEIPIKTHIILNSEAISSIKRFILGFEGLYFGYYIIGDPIIKSMEIID